jgi:hypothetical protein
MEKQQQFEYAAGLLFPLASASGLENIWKIYSNFWL